MKTKTILLSLLGLFILPVSAFAALAVPIVTTVPATINANTYTLTIKVPIGSKVTVVGGPSDLAPVTDGAGGDKLDGVVKIMVGLAQEQTNVFSIIAEKNGESSSSITITIKETSKTSATTETSKTPTVRKGDVTPPSAPVIDPIKDPVTGTKYTITGSSESLAKIFVEKTDGTSVDDTAADSNGIFDIDVDLLPGKTNRFNIYAKDVAGNTGPIVQAVIISTAPATTANETGAVNPTGLTPFTDVNGHWAEAFIAQIYDQGIANGKADGKFDPNANITRAELTKIALNAFGHTVGSNQPTENPFADVPKGEWYAVYIALAKELNIVSGFADGFHPNEPITRAGALKILLVASGLDVGNGTTDFSDVESGAWYEKYVAYAKANGIVGGYTDNTFRPDNNITRAEVAKIVVKILELVK